MMKWLASKSQPTAITVWGVKHLLILALSVLILIGCASPDKLTCTLVPVEQPAPFAGSDLVLKEAFAGGPVRAVELDEEYAYLSLGNMLVVLDISDPTNITQVSEIFLPNYMASISLVGDYLFTRDSSLPPESNVVNVSDPAHPREMKCQEDVPLSFATVTTSEEYAYVPDWVDGGLKIYDVTNSNRLVEIASYISAPPPRIRIWPDPRIIRSDPRFVGNIVVAGQYAYVAENEWVRGEVYLESGRVRILDVSDPSNPKPVGVFTSPGDIPIRQLALEGNKLLVQAREDLTHIGRLHVLDISEPASPEEIETFRTSGHILAVTKGHAYLSYIQDGIVGVHVRDLSGETQLLNWDDEPYSRWYGRSEDVAIDGNHIYFAAGPLVVVDVSEPQHPELVDSVAYPLFNDIRGVVVEENVGFLAKGSDGLSIVQFSEEGALRLAHLNVVANDVAVSDGRAYLAAGQEGLLVVDISNPEEPTILNGHVLPEFSAERIAANGASVYLLDPEQGMRVLDASSLTEIITEGSYQETAFSNYYDVEASEEVVFLIAGRERGDSVLQILEKSTPFEPVTVREYRREEGVYRVASSDGRVYVGSGSFVEMLAFKEKDELSESLRYEIPLGLPPLGSFDVTGGAIHASQIRSGFIILEPLGGERWGSGDQ